MNEKEIKEEVAKVFQDPAIKAKLLAALKASQEETERLQKARQIDMRCRCHADDFCFYHTRFI